MTFPKRWGRRASVTIEAKPAVEPTLDVACIFSAETLGAAGLLPSFGEEFVNPLFAFATCEDARTRFPEAIVFEKDGAIIICH